MTLPPVIPPIGKILKKLGDVKDVEELNSKMENLFPDLGNLINGMLYLSRSHKTPLSIKKLILETGTARFEREVIRYASFEEWRVLSKDFLKDLSYSYNEQLKVANDILKVFEAKPEYLVASFYSPGVKSLAIADLVNKSKSKVPDSEWRGMVVSLARNDYGEDVDNLPYGWVEALFQTNLS